MGSSDGYSQKILGAVGVTEKDYMDKVNKIVQVLNES